LDKICNYNKYIGCYIYISVINNYNIFTYLPQELTIAEIIKEL